MLDIKLCQTALNSLIVPTLEVDGKLGPKTKAALETYSVLFLTNSLPESFKPMPSFIDKINALTSEEKLALALLALHLITSGSDDQPASVDSNPNVTPTKGQILTKSASFDAALQGIAERTGIPFNTLIFHLNSESGLDEKAHVGTKKVPALESDGVTQKKNKDGSLKFKTKYVFGQHDLSSIGPTTWGGGLFGLVRPYSKPYFVNGSFEGFLQASDLEQLAQFEIFITPYKNKIKSPADIRMVGFAPAFVGNTNMNAKVYYDGASYEAHKFLDTDKDGAIEVGELLTKWTNDYNKLASFANTKGRPKQVAFYGNDGKVI